MKTMNILLCSCVHSVKLNSYYSELIIIIIIITLIRITLHTSYHGYYTNKLTVIVTQNNEVEKDNVTLI